MVNDIIVQRQINLVAMFQDEVSLRVQDKKDPSVVMSALREAISLLKELMALEVATPPKTVAPPRAERPRVEEYERDIRKQYERVERQKSLPPTQYVYNDGFHGVTLPSEQQSHQEQREPYEPYTVEEKEYWDNEQ